MLFQVKSKISRDSCRSSFDLREAAGAKKGEERKDMMVSPSFQGSALPASWNTFTDTGKVNISRCFFSWVSRPPPWWPSDRSRLRSIGGERRRASVGWCGAAAAGVDQSEIEGRGGGSEILGGKTPLSADPLHIIDLLMPRWPYAALLLTPSEIIC